MERMEPLVNSLPLKVKPHMSLSRENAIHPRIYLSSKSVLEYVDHLPRVPVSDEIHQSTDLITKRLADDFKDHLVNRKKNRKAINDKSYQRIIEHLKMKRAKAAEEPSRQRFEIKGDLRQLLLRQQLQQQQQQQQLLLQRRARMKKLPTIQSPTSNTWNSTASQLPRIPSGVELHSFDTESQPYPPNGASGRSSDSSNRSNNTDNYVKNAKTKEIS